MKVYRCSHGGVQVSSWRSAWGVQGAGVVMKLCNIQMKLKWCVCVVMDMYRCSHRVA